MADIQDALNDAKGFGYSNDEIVKYLSKHPVYGSQVKEALDQGHSADDIVGFLSGPSKTEEPFSVGGSAKAFATGGKELLEGAGAGVAHTLTGLRDIAAKAFPGIPEFPTLREAGTTPPEASPYFKTGKLAEQFGEFFLPGSIVGKAVEKVAPLGTAAEIFTRGAGEAAAAGATTYAQTGGNAEQAAKAALAAGGMSAGMATIGQALKAVAPKVYAGPTFRGLFPSRFQREGILEEAKGTGESRINEIVGTAIDNGINLSLRGAGKAAVAEAASQAERDAMLTQHANDLVDPSIVLSPLNNLRDMLEGVPGKEKAVRRIDKEISDVLTAHGYVPPTPATPATSVTSPIVGPSGAPIVHTIPGKPAVPATPPQITVEEAQRLKNVLQNEADSAWGKTAKGARQAQLDKSLSVGYMKALEDVIPELRAANRDIQNKKLLKNAVVDMMASDPNSRHEWAIAAALFGHPTALSYLALTNLRVRSALAIIADRMSQGLTSGAGVAGRGAAMAAPQVPNLLAPPIPQMPVGVRTQQ